MRRSEILIVVGLLALGCGGEEPSASEGSSSGPGEPGSSGAPAPTSTGVDASTSTSAADTTSDESTTVEPTSDTGDLPPPPPPPEVNGLRGEYFSKYIDLKLERIDPTVDFDWGDGAPAEGIGANRFSIRWTGYLVAPTTGIYKLISETDDGVRVWVGETLVIDDWNAQFVSTNAADVELTADAKTPIRIEYFEVDMPAQARIRWSSEQISEQPIPTQHLIAAEAASGLPAPKPPYLNPAVPFDCPDPGILKVANDEFYMVCTGGKFPIRRSRDLIFWNDTDAVVLPNGKPSWAANGNRNWAPEIHRVGAQYIAYFTTVNGNNVLCIGAATAEDPLGPYTESPGPLVQNPLGVIDATYIEDGDKKFLVYKIDGNSQGMPTPILSRQLGEDGISFVGEPVELLRNNSNTWEGGVAEAQWLVQRDGYFYMFYSGNVYDHRYRTGVARRKDLSGPFEKLGPPILANNDAWVGPGHGTVVKVHGIDYFVYHAWVEKGGVHDQSQGRNVLVDRIDWDGGWPHIHDGTPSRTWQVWPGVAP